ncbi:protein phosphatase 2C [Thecamonas trahens ATCC 50062]|uniref:Protein phosphatase 2C n=1 Tax=Thecamonas trahens ATCC 50062 TaxID=461836 RepID=A0A0L0DQM7_THETB|nr:protein phosphatase 2C [Thecamonas trahens ATCC 50062]KNC53738.1 protein phosphatase 2C [Thecamonas trahens ATCC 50062]|eukprot:XP_013754301.1 protein phosphatase 2C [Thecamonas trahens ATCC 50062]
MRAMRGRTDEWISEKGPEEQHHAVGYVSAVPRIRVLRGRRKRAAGKVASRQAPRDHGRDHSRDRAAAEHSRREAASRRASKGWQGCNTARVGKASGRRRPAWHGPASMSETPHRPVTKGASMTALLEQQRQKAARRGGGVADGGDHGHGNGHPSQAPMASLGVEQLQNMRSLSLPHSLKETGPMNASLKTRALGQYRRLMRQNKIKKQYQNAWDVSELMGVSLYMALELARDRIMAEEDASRVLTRQELVTLHTLVSDAVAAFVSETVREVEARAAHRAARRARRIAAVEAKALAATSGASHDSATAHSLDPSAHDLAASPDSVGSPGPRRRRHRREPGTSDRRRAPLRVQSSQSLSADSDDYSPERPTPTRQFKSSAELETKHARSAASRARAEDQALSEESAQLSDSCDSGSSSSTITSPSREEDSGSSDSYSKGGVCPLPAGDATSTSSSSPTYGSGYSGYSDYSDYSSEYDSDGESSTATGAGPLRPVYGPDALRSPAAAKLVFAGDELREVLVNAVDEWEPEPDGSAMPVQVAGARTQGSRSHLEDTFLCTPFLEALCLGESVPETAHAEPTFLASIFDGHNGAYASEYAVSQLFLPIGNALASRSSLAGAELDNSELGAVVTLACLDVDATFNAKATRESLNDGSTALIVLLRGKKLFVANVGDSHAVVSDAGTAHLLSSMHSPKRPDEEERIINSGGSVVWFGTWRVNGSLAVSRSIGDPQYQDIVIPNPEFATYDVLDSYEFVLLASDGVWDVFPHQDAVDFVRSRLLAGASPGAVIDALLDEAVHARSSPDNATAVLLVLRTPVDDPPSPASAAPPLLVKHSSNLAIVPSSPLVASPNSAGAAFHSKSPPAVTCNVIAPSSPLVRKSSSESISRTSPASAAS